MEARAQLKYLRMSPRKVRLVVDLVRGKTVAEARDILRFLPNRPARYLAKLLRSAAANAETNHSMDRDVLRISRAYVDQGPSLKRWQPVSRGMAHPILKRTCHVTVYVEEDEGLAAQKEAEDAKTRRGRRRTKKAESPAGADAAKAPKGAAKPQAEAAPAKRGGRRAKPESPSVEGESEKRADGDGSEGEE
jgi:large subunit ribosomal protein L22